MSAEEVLATFEELIKNADQLKNGKELLEDLIDKVPKFVVTTCQIITSQEVDSNFRKLVGYIMKNVLKDNWVEHPVIAQQRDEIKEILLNGLVINVNDPKILEVLSLTIAELIKQEGPANWQVYLKELINWINSNSEDLTIVNAGLECLCLLLAGTDNRMNVIVPTLMPVLYNIFTNPELTEKMREQLLKLLYLCIETFSYAEGTDNSLIHACFDQTYQEWISIFISALQTSVKSNINIKRLILKILTKIFSDMPYYTSKTLNVIIQPVWKFMNANLSLFIWSTVYGVPVEQIEDGMKQPPKDIQTKKYSPNDEGFDLNEDADMIDYVEGLAIQLLELMITLTEKKQLEPILRFGLFPIINCVSHYLLFSKEQERRWFDDANQFISDEEDLANMVSLRNSAQRVIGNLVQTYSHEATQAIMVIVEKFLKNMKEEEVYGFLKAGLEKLNMKQSKASALQDFDADKLLALIKTSHFEGEHPDHIWKKREVGLFLLGTFCEEIVYLLNEKGQGEEINNLIEQLVFSLEDNSNPILKGRTIWCLSQFSEVIPTKDSTILLHLFKVCSHCMHPDNYLPVRLTAAQSLRTFAHKIEKFFWSELKDDIKTEYRLNSFENIECLFDLLEKVNEDTIHIILEGLNVLARMNPQFIPKIALGFAPKLTQLFQMFHHDALNGQVITDLIRQFCTQQESFNTTTEVLMPYILEILEFKVTTGQPLGAHLNLGKSTEEHFLSGLFDLIRLFVKSPVPQKNEETLLKLLPVINMFILESEDYALLNHASACLKAYITCCSDYIKNNNLTPEIFKVISKLLKPDTNEAGIKYVGNLIILTFANLLNNSVNTDILKEVISKLSKVKLPESAMSLVLVYARLINIDAKETLTFLTSFSFDNKLALKILIDKWLLQQPLFTGKNTRVSTFLALTKLFLLKDSRIESLLVIGYNPSHSNPQEVYAPFKIFSLLIRGLDAEVKRRAEMGQGGNKLQDEFYGEDGRLDTVGDDDDYNWKEDGDDEDDDKIDVGDFNIQKGDDDYGYLEKKFNIGGGGGGKGFADVETGSACYMSEFLGYDIEAEEADPIAEEDLIYLNDISVNLDLINMLKEFFATVAKEDPEYFGFCVKHLLPEDVKLVQHYSQLKE